VSITDGMRPRWPVLIAVWTIPALLSVFETVTFAHVGGHDIALWRALVAEAPAWYVWAALTPAILRLGRRFPLHHGLRPAAIAVHLTSSLAAGALYATVASVCTLAVRPTSRTLGVMIFDWLLSGLPLIVVAYVSIIGIGYALDRQREAERLRAELAVAQLGALRAQLQPHFLFNTLNAITALVRDRDTQGALDTLAKLSDLLRSVLAPDAADEVSLGDELAFVERYLGIMEVRFSDRLRVTWDVPDELRVAQVPALVLQPLVENAIRHGIARSTAAGRIEIAARRRDDRLVLTVRDDGPGPSDTVSAGGVGLRNTRARLEHLYGEAGVTLTANGAGGALATVTMPYHGRR
jgi:two-component system, LytTR family, sensor kinase